MEETTTPRARVKPGVLRVASAKEVPRLGVELEPHLRPTPQPRQHGIQAASLTYTAARGNARSLTHWARPAIESTSSWIIVGFLTRWTITGTPTLTYFILLSLILKQVIIFQLKQPWINMLYDFMSSMLFVSSTTDTVTLRPPHFCFFVLFFFWRALIFTHTCVSGTN